jgi:hypothetical protein
LLVPPVGRFHPPGSNTWPDFINEIAKTDSGCPVVEARQAAWRASKSC